MQAYEYEAIDAKGKTKKGIISADSAKAARRDLKAKQLVPLQVKETRQKAKTAAKSGSLSHKDRTLITRQLATLVGAASPIEQALGTIANQSDKPAIKQVLLAVRGDVLEGQKFSTALERQPKSFDPLYCSLVASGEGAGSLPQVLERLAEHMEKVRAMRNKVQTALIYPAVLTVVAIGVVIGLMTFVVPKVATQFESMGQELPGLTRFMISASDAIAAYGIFVAIGLFAMIALFGYQMRQKAFRRRVHATMLKLPLAGRLLREMSAANFARTMSTLVSSGVPVVGSLAATQSTISNDVVKEAVGHITTDVREGKSLSVAMRRANIFPAMLTYMVASGENSGTLPELLAKSADYLESEFESFTNAMLSLLEPVIIVIMGGVVATIVLSILMPILQLNSLAAL